MGRKLEIIWKHSGEMVVDGVEYAPVVEPKPKTGRQLYINGRPMLFAWNPYRFREDPECSDIPDIVDATGKVVGYVSIDDEGVSVE